MKKKFVFAALAVAALLSCSKDDTISVNKTNNGIMFGVLNNKVQTKATETTVTNIGSFNVFAYIHDNGVVADYTTTTPYYDNVVINVDNAGNCTYADGTKQKMWPSGKEVNFLAFSPSTTEYTYLKGTVSTDLTTKLAAADQKDLVVAQSLNQSGIGQDNYKTQMKFYHALSQIKFSAKSKYSSVTFKVKSITLTGVNTSGSAPLTTWTPVAPNGTNNTGNGLVWTPGGTSTNMTFGAKTN